MASALARSSRTQDIASYMEFPGTPQKWLPQLVSEYMSEASGEDPGVEFVLSCQDRNWAILFRRAWAGGLGKTNKDSMFLSLGYVFV